MTEIVLYCLIPVVAFLYAAVGHGGASGYLALMALFSLPPDLMRPTALLLNLFVAGISFIHFWHAGYFKWRLFIVFATASIPFSFLGGLIEIDPVFYKLTLGILLLFAVARMLNLFGRQSDDINQINWPLGLFFGASIGFFSGLIGIGGGIILSPVILLLNWGNVKETAAVSALFIWVNSAAGFTGQWLKGIELDPMVWLMIGLSIVGGFLGGYFGSKKLQMKPLSTLLAFVLLLASVKLILL